MKRIIVSGICGGLWSVICSGLGYGGTPMLYIGAVAIGVIVGLLNFE